MIVVFTFPGEPASSFKINMECVPRDKEEIAMAKVDEDDFAGKKDYYAFKANGYDFKKWVVGAVSWSPMRKGESFVTIMLKEA